MVTVMVKNMSVKKKSKESARESYSPCFRHCVSEALFVKCTHLFLFYLSKSMAYSDIHRACLYYEIPVGPEGLGRAKKSTRVWSHKDSRMRTDYVASKLEDLVEDIMRVWGVKRATAVDDVSSHAMFGLSHLKRKDRDAR
jgi:hypothetical protein